MFILSLLLLLFTAHASPQHGLVSTCVVYEIAFPNGHLAADLTQNLCHLVEENLSGFNCEDFQGLQMGTAGDFVEQVYSKQAEFCNQHTGIMSTDSADSQMLLEVALAETMLTVPKGLKSSEPKGEVRRRLFIEDIIDAVSGAVDDYYLWICEGYDMIGLFGSSRKCSQYFAEIGLLCMWKYADKFGWVFDRRALQTTEVASSSFVINANSIFTECSYGLGSYLCDVPLMDILNFFNTGTCARANGLICVVQKDDFLALAAPAVQP